MHKSASRPAAADGRFEALDSWRGICACLVAMMHFNSYSHIHDAVFLRNSYLFVDFFFVLSGFVIAANYRERLGRGFGIVRFMQLRFGRLYPLHVVMLVAFVGFEAIQLALPALGSIGESAPFAAPRQSLDTIIANLLLLHSFDLYGFLTWNTPSWSIATEFWTYLLFALAVAWFGRRLGILLTVVMIAAPLAILHLSVKGMNTTHDYGMVRCAFGFAAGVAVHGLWLRFKVEGRSIRRNATLTEIMAIAGVAGFVLIAGQSPISVLAPYVFGVAIFIFALESGKVSTCLRVRPLLFLGALSYSIYMVHMFVQLRLMNTALLLQAKLGIPLMTVVQVGGKSVKLLGRSLWQGDLGYVAMLALVIATSAISYRIIEVPAREWFRRCGSPSRKKVRPVALAAAWSGAPAGLESFEWNTCRPVDPVIREDLVLPNPLDKRTPDSNRPDLPQEAGQR